MPVAARRRRSRALFHPAYRSAALAVGLALAAAGAPAQVPGGAALARACRRTLADAADVRAAAHELAPTLPAARWGRLTLAALPARVPASVRASVLPPPPDDPEAGPLLYWRAGLTGADVLHELTHAAQAALAPPARGALLARVAAHDRGAGFAPEVVEGATRSVVEALAMAAGAGATLDALRGAVARLPRGGAGALAARHAALAHALARPALARARAALPAAEGPAGAPWGDALGALLLAEAHAYDAARACRAGGASALWDDGAAPAPIATTAAR